MQEILQFSSAIHMDNKEVTKESVVLCQWENKSNKT